GGYTPPVSPRHPAAGQQTENPSSPAAAVANEEGTQSRENAGGGVQTPRASRTKRRAQDSGARLRGSGRRSGKKRQAKVKARRSLARLQPQLEQKIADMDYDEQQSVAKAEAKARKEREIAEAERKKTASTTPGVRSRRRDQDGRDHEQLPIVTEATERGSREWWTWRLEHRRR
ncbi:unnamed protein product, partial [Ectocarpus sp. 4 AP-2014]